ncbi:hypothetical protein KPY62_01605 [Psychrobacter sp. TAE2020]|uniref:hypothetical protein n=1 Tax=Psychrobacter sp. TAE2020 TaxID=2846762 RepID=UPI001C0F55B2|nr:hypothetical protein [Psychrobacter sp. TAE2020]MBU5615817.1 hypothetical protein [Psychrobacter sp. TAE2020]
MELNDLEKTTLLESFEIDFKYNDVVYIENFDYFFIFNKERYSDDTDFLAKVYNKEGSYVLTVPFPYVEIYHKEINVGYRWSWEVENGLRIVFNTNEMIIDDFWYEFDLVQRKYTSHGKAY